MALKKFARKPIYKKRKPFKKRSATKKAGSATYHPKSKESMIVYNGSIHKFPLPDRYRTVFYTRYDATNLGGTSTSAQYFDVKLNSVNVPFNPPVVGALSTLTVKSANNWISQFSGQTALASLQPTGSSILLNSDAYNYFTVRRASITVELEISGETVLSAGANNTGVAQNVGETTVCILPFTYSSNVAANVPPTTIGQAMRQRLAVTRKLRSVGKHRISCSATPAEVLGVPEKAIDYDLSGDNNGTASTSPASLIYFRVYWYVDSTLGRPTGDAIGVELKQNVDLWNMSVIAPTS